MIRSPHLARVVLLLALSTPADAQVAVGPFTAAAYVQSDALFALKGDPYGGTDTFRMRRARFTLSGELVKDITWTVSIEGTAPDAPVRDAYVTFRRVPWLQVRAGQFVTPFSLERQTSTGVLEAIDRAIDVLTPSRDMGIQVFSARPIGGWVGYGVGVVNGTGQNQRDDNDAKDLVGRVTITPPFATALVFGVNAASGAQPAGRRDRYGADVEVRVRSFRGAAEILRESNEHGPDRTGFYVVGVQRLGHWEAVGRVSRLRRDEEGNLRLELGGNYYFVGRTRLMANINVSPNAEGSPVGFLARLQLAF